MNNESVISKDFAGWVVVYSSKSEGIDSYLTVKNWHNMAATSCFLLTNSTIFENSDTAKTWAEKHPDLLDTRYYSVPEIMPVWRLSTLTVEKSSSDKVIKAFQEAMTRSMS